MRLTLLTKDNPILRAHAAPVAEDWLETAECRTLIKNMIETMHKANGIGLAAPQIGQSIRLATIAFRDGDLVLANPVILKHSLRTMTEEEGCLSVPGVFGRVKRYASLVVRFLNRDGDEETLDAAGLFARVVQHEIDHLNGLLFIDRTTNFTKGRP